MAKGAWLVVALGAGLLAPAGARGADNGWLRLETKNLTIFTQGHERKARDKAVEMERFIAGLDSLFPQAKPHRTPLTVVLFANAAEFQAYTPVVNNVAQPVGGYFTRLPHRGFIAMPLEGENLQVRRTIFHEGVHWYFSFLPSGRPPWFDEGLAEVLSTFELRRREDLIGRAIDEHVLVLTYLVRPPLAELLRTPRESLNYNEALRTGAFYSLSWAFVHYVIFGQGGGGANSLAKYLNELQQGTEPKEAFGRAFGTDFAGMEERVYTYLKSGKYGVIRTKFDPESIDRTIRRSAADATDMDLTLGLLNLVANRRPAALQRLERVLAARPDDPATREAWGMLELARGNVAEARVHFQKAVALGSQSFICYFALAAARAQEWRDAAVKTENIPPAEAREVAHDLQRTINLEPQLEEAYVGLAELLIAAWPLTLEDRKFLELGARRFPRNADIEVGIANFDFRVGRAGAAVERIDALLASTREISSIARDRATILQRRAGTAHRLEELTRLVDAGELAAAATGIEAALEAQPFYTERLELLALQQRLGRRQAVALAVEAQGRGDFGEVRRCLERLGAAAPDPADVAVVERLRSALERVRTP